MTPDLNQPRNSGTTLGATVFTLPLLLSVATTLSGCSWLSSSLRLDSVSDSVEYRSQAGTVASLEIPPGLTTPRFDDTYVIARSVQVDSKMGSGDPVPVPLVPGIVADARPALDAAGGFEPAQQRLPVVLTQLKDGNPVLAVGGAFDQVWVKTGEILAQSGLTIEDQQREKGIYSVTASKAAKDEGLLRKVWGKLNIFANNKDKSGDDVAGAYRVVIGDAGDQSLMVVSDSAGKPLEPALAKQVLERLKAGFEG